MNNNHMPVAIRLAADAVYKQLSRTGGMSIAATLLSHLRGITEAEAQQAIDLASQWYEADQVGVPS